MQIYVRFPAFQTFPRQDIYSIFLDMTDIVTRLLGIRYAVEMLLDTGVGKAVRRLKKHSDVQVAKTAHNLVEKWKTMAEEQCEIEGEGL